MSDTLTNNISYFSETNNWTCEKKMYNLRKEPYEFCIVVVNNNERTNEKFIKKKKKILQCCVALRV